MKKLSALLLSGVLVSGCATNRNLSGDYVDIEGYQKTAGKMGHVLPGRRGGSLSGDHVQEDDYQKTGGKMSYISPRRSEVNLAGDKDKIGPLEDFGRGILSLRVDAPLSRGEWKNNPYFTGGVLAKDIVLGAILAESLSSSSSGSGSGSSSGGIKGGGGYGKPGGL